jgi:Tol biopolymer transport system component
MAGFTNGQDLKTGKIRKVKTSEKVFFPTFGNDRNEILFTSSNYRGLYKLDLKRSRNPKILLEKEIQLKSITRLEDKDFKIDLEKRTEGSKTIQQMRLDADLETLSELNSNNGTLAIKPDGKHLIVKEPAQEEKVISPAGDVYYIWPSISPDRSKILFTAAGKGSYISDLNGNILSELGHLNSPKWLNEEWVIGMRDEDDGYITTQSDVIAVNILSGNEINLTANFEGIAVYPAASLDARKVVFHTPEGALYKLFIRIRNK